MDLTEAEDIRKRWQEYTEELYKENLHDEDNHDGVITHLNPDLGRSLITNKVSGGDGILVQLFQILKDDTVKVFIQYASKFGKLSSGHRTGKVLFSLQSQRQCERMFKLLHNCTHFTCYQSNAQNSPS